MGNNEFGRLPQGKEFNVQEHKERVIALNPDQDPITLFNEETWDIRRFSEGNHLPVKLGDIANRTEFSEQCGIRVLDMPIYIPGQGWAIPENLSQFKEAIEMAAIHEAVVNPDIDDYYVYITVDQKTVVPGKTQRRAGWHSDAYITDETGRQLDVKAENAVDIKRQDGRLVDRTYIASDGLPTWFLPGPFPIEGDPQDCDQVLNNFDKMAEGQEPITYPSYMLSVLDPYDVHTSAPNLTGEEVKRTFIKISFSKQIYNREVNTRNPLLEYNWVMVSADKSKRRQHRNHIIGFDREDRDQYLSVDPLTLLKGDISKVDWVEPEIFTAQKVEGVKAEKAVPGEKMETVINNFRMTTNTAEEGDWKIITS